MGRHRGPRHAGTLAHLASRALTPAVLALVAVVAGVGGAVAIATSGVGSFRPGESRTGATAGHRSGAVSFAGPVRTLAPSRSTNRAAVMRVRPLRALTAPDVLVSLPGPASGPQIAAVRRVPGVAGVAVLDVGVVRTSAGRFKAVGVDPSEFRAFTPRWTAVSDPLWRSVARGEMTLSFSRATPLRRELGDDVAVAGARISAIRLGAFASIGLPDTDVVVSHQRARDLQLVPAHSLLVAAPRLTIAQLTAAARGVFGASARVRELRPEAFDQSLISSYALSVIPASYLRLYRGAASTCRGLPWTVLAAIGAVETGHGSNNGVSSAGAMGPMQFLPSTFRSYAVDGDGDGVANINDPADAVYSAANYLCASGAGRGGQALYDAIFAYNHADWYVREVLALAIRYQ